MALTQINSEGIKDGEVKTSDIADQSVNLTKLPHGDGSSNGKFLRSNNGADPTWESVSTTPEGTSVLSTGETGTAKFLRVDGDDSCSWQVPPDTQLTTEEVQDIVGAMFTGNTETNITATYEDSDGTIDLVSTDTNTQLTQEQVEDFVGGMVTGNTETGITVTYEDSDGTLDFVVASQTDENFTSADHTKLDGIAASANNYVHPNHSGEVTSTADGATVIADDIVDEANLKIDNSPTNDYVLTAKSSAAGGLTWAEASGGGATGGGSDKVFHENGTTVTTNYTITNNMNAGTFGPITINNGVTVTVGDGEYWTVV